MKQIALIPVVTGLFVLGITTAQAAVTCTEYQQYKDELARNGKQAMIDKYCKYYAWVEDMSEIAQKYKDPKIHDTYCAADLDKMQSLLAAKSSAEILKRCSDPKLRSRFAQPTKP